ncbi:MAG: double zinc ribbon domain-containing protein [Gemmatimonadota bacterium]
MRPGGWARLLDRVLPPACPGCLGPLAVPSDPLCARCRLRLAPLPWPRCDRCGVPRGTGAEGLPCRECAGWPASLAWARSAVAFDGPAVRLVHGLKYQGWWRVADLMAAHMAPLLAGVRGVLVPVPTTPGRARIRGYNQAELIARKLSLEAGLDVFDVLERAPARRSQVALPRLERMANVVQAFRVRSAARSGLRGAELILVDDVLTTGATAAAVAGALSRAGLARLAIVTFARTLPPGARATPP